jgi:hypothetical protein
VPLALVNNTDHNLADRPDLQEREEKFKNERSESQSPVNSGKERD